MHRHTRTALDALARASGRLPPEAPALASAPAAGPAPHCVAPSQAAGIDTFAYVDKLNAAYGLVPGPNFRGAFAVPASRQAASPRGVRSPEELADMVNAEAGLRPGPNVPPGFAEHFARLSQGEE